MWYSTYRLPDGLLDYTSAVIHFASDYVVDRVFEKYIDSTKNRLIDAVNHCKDSWLSGIRGQLFEWFAHFSFMNHEYDIKCLEPAHSMFNKVPKKKFGKLIETPRSTKCSSTCFKQGSEGSIFEACTEKL